MTKWAISLMVFLGLSLLSGQAQGATPRSGSGRDTSWTPLKLSWDDDFALPRSLDVRGLNLSLWRTSVEHFYGIQYATAWNEAKDDSYGLQISAGINATRQKTVGLQIAGISSAASTLKGFQIGGLVSLAQRMDGVQIAGLTNALSNVRGIQISGIGNSNAWGSYGSRGNSGGLQIGGVGNLDFSDYTGIKIGGVGNISQRDKGLQLGGIGNVAKETIGIQVGGGNITHALRGAQIGLFLWNYAAGFRGAQFGPVNLCNERPGKATSVRNTRTLGRSYRANDDSFDNAGIQLGLVNACDDLRGVQIGLINYCRRLRGLQLGALNIIGRSGRMSPVMVGLNLGW